MQQPQPSPTAGASSFAGFLAALTAPPSVSQDRGPLSDDDGLEDDVATLSYERALRAHARYRPADAIPPSAIPPSAIPAGASDYSLTQSPRQGPLGMGQPPAAGTNPVQQPAAVQVHPSALERNLKSASITIRMSHDECAQLRNRAADAGLTVSAYLRSCTLEAESLRAQVKDALARLRAGESSPKPSRNPSSNASGIAPDLTPDRLPGRRSWLHWPSRA